MNSTEEHHEDKEILRNYLKTLSEDDPKWERYEKCPGQSYWDSQYWVFHQKTKKEKAEFKKTRPIGSNDGLKINPFVLRNDVEELEKEYIEEGIELEEYEKYCYDTHLIIETLKQYFNINNISLNSEEIEDYEEILTCYGHDYGYQEQPWKINQEISGADIYDDFLNHTFYFNKI
jgi:hypothetical protein